MSTRIALEGEKRKVRKEKGNVSYSLRSSKSVSNSSLNPEFRSMLPKPENEKSSLLFLPRFPKLTSTPLFPSA